MKKKLRGCYIVHVKGVVWHEYEHDYEQRLSKSELERDLMASLVSKVWTTIAEHEIVNVLDVNAYLNGLGTFSVEIVREEE